MERLCRTGLVIPDRVPWGTHLCQFYETRDDLLEVLVPYFKEGLAGNESCLWIISDPLSVKDAKTALRAAVPRLDHCLANGQMEIIAYDTWYLRDGSFNSDAALAACRGRTDLVVSRGYAGLRVSGDAGYLQTHHGDALAAYEKHVQSSLHAYHTIALCSYPLDKCTASQFLQAVDAHDCAIVRRHGRWQCTDGTGGKQLLDRLLVQKHAIASSISPLVVTDLAGRLTYANPAALQAWGYQTEHEMLDRHATEFWQDPHALLAHLAEVQASGRQISELVAKRKDNSTFDAEVLGSVVLDEDGGVRGFIEAVKDITERKKAEKQLAHFSAIVNSSQDAIFGKTLDGIVTSWNLGAARLYGYTADEMIGQPMSKVLPPERSDEVSILLARLKDGRRIERFDTVRRRKDGTLVDVSVTLSAIKNGEGQIIGVSAIAHEITDRKRAEDSLRESEERLRNIIHTASEIIYTLSLDGVFTFVSPAWVRKLGHDLSEVEGHRFDDFVHPDDIPVCRAYLRKVVTTDEPQPSVEYRVRHKNGGWHWHRTNGSCVRDRAGQPVYCVGVAEDITERKHAQEVLRESEERYRCLVENVDLGITLIDRQHRIVMVNEGHARMFKRTAKECIGRECFRLFEKREAVCPHCPGVRAMATGCPAEVESEGKRGDGSAFPVQLRAFPVRNSDSTTSGFIEVVEDITDRKRTERELTQAKLAAEAANRTKSEFLANMSHEIRTPMTAIVGFSDILLGENLTEEAAEICQIIKRNGEHLLHLINDILDLSKIEAGRHGLDLEACSPRHIVADVIGTMQVRADAKGLSLAVEYGDGIPLEIRTDPLRLRQILVNLLGNAIKFTEVGGIRLAVARNNAPEGGEGLRFDVIDSGIGIAEEHIGMLFQPFFQVDGSARRGFGGTGLGLAISRRLAVMLGGDISVSSIVGKGTTFSVTIAAGPLGDAGSSQHSAHADEPIAASRSDSPRLSCRILLVEDGPDNQRLIAFLLRKAGAEVAVVEDGQKAVDLIMRQQETADPFDLILMDMQMPIMDGYEATRKLREMGYGGPILALTAHAMKEDRQKCLDAGCDDYLAKPVDRGILLQLVSKYTGPLRPIGIR